MARRNPGPSWGFPFLMWVDRITSPRVFEFLARLGAGIGVALMPEQRRASRDYLTRILGRDPGWRGPFRHFGDFAMFLAERLRLHRGIEPRFQLVKSERATAFEAFCRSGEQALFGTFHIGQSDLMSSMLREYGRTVAIVRERVDNSLDTEVLENFYGANLQFVFINDPVEFLFVLKEAIGDGRSLGIQCDRLKGGDRREVFRFLNMQCLFPMTIYHLGHLFKLPVAFAIAGGRNEEGAFLVKASTIYRPTGHRPGQAARDHFQSVLDLVEAHLRKFPYLWFNFSRFNVIPSRNPVE